MTATILVTLDTEGSTDLVGIAQEINDILSDQFNIRSVASWSHPSLNLTVQTPPVVPGQQQTQ